MSQSDVGSVGESQELPPLTEQQEYALMALMQEPTVEDAAIAASVEVRTLRGWLVEDEHFILHHRNAQRKKLAAMVRRLQETVPVLARQLAAIATDAQAPPRARVSASRTLLQYGLEAQRAVQVNQPREAVKQAQQFDAATQRAQGSSRRSAPPRPKPQALSELQQAAIEALAHYGTAVEAAEQAKVGLRTLQRWMNSHDSFKAHSAAARGEGFAAIGRVVAGYLGQMIEQLVQIASSETLSVAIRLTASRTLVQCAWRGQQLMEEAETLETRREYFAAKDRKRLAA